MALGVNKVEIVGKLDAQTGGERPSNKSCPSLSRAATSGWLMNGTAGSVNVLPTALPVGAVLDTSGWTETPGAI